jgi:hypothetical protein
MIYSTNGAAPPGEPTPDERLKAAMEAFAQRLIGSQTNGNMVFEYDPAALLVQHRLLFIHVRTLIEVLAEAGLPTVTLIRRFTQNIEAQTEELRKPSIAQSVGSIIRR